MERLKKLFDASANLRRLNEPKRKAARAALERELRAVGLKPTEIGRVWTPPLPGEPVEKPRGSRIPPEAGFFWDRIWGATNDRIIYERELMNIKAPDPRDPKRALTPEGQQLKKAADRAAKALTACSEREPAFRAVGKEHEETMERYLLKRPATERPKLAAHRQREPWFEIAVLDLARLLRRRGISWNGTERFIKTGFYEAGHHDLMLTDWVGSIIRAARRKDPRFGQF